jgi:hypothetical protein
VKLLLGEKVAGGTSFPDEPNVALGESGDDCATVCDHAATNDGEKCTDTAAGAERGGAPLAAAPLASTRADSSISDASTRPAVGATAFDGAGDGLPLNAAEARAAEDGAAATDSTTDSDDRSWCVAPKSCDPRAAAVATRAALCANGADRAAAVSGGGADR